jgi:hypothetical protein
MRFMMLLPAPAQALEKFAVPDPEIVLTMRKFNADMTKAGVLLAAEGLHPTSKGTRLRVSGGKRVITDGPFAEAKEVIAGFWIIQAKSKEEAIEWAKRCPLPENGLIEIRQVFENCDFPPELQKKSA